MSVLKRRQKTQQIKRWKKLSPAEKQDALRRMVQSSLGLLAELWAKNSPEVVEDEGPPVRDT